MLTDNTVLLAALGIALTVLVVVQFLLAARHDHVVSAQPRWATIDELEARIQTRKAELTDFDEEIRKRREQMENVAENEARIDALIRQRDELQAEWESLGEKREEVRRIREETERA
jgi:chromosome segregation ATPase